MTDETFQDAEARDSAQEREAARHKLTVKAASALFAEFGVPRSPRSVQGFCKDGHIDCVRVKGPNGDRYFVNRQSVEHYATELKQIEEVGKISSDDPFAQEREPARGSAQPRAEVVIEKIIEHISDDDRGQKLDDVIKVLREENLNLKIDNRGKEQFINQLVQDRTMLMESVQEVNYKLGAAETRLHQLEAPREAVRDSAQERAEARDVEKDHVVEVAEVKTETVIDTAVPVTTAEQSKPSFFRRVFGG